MAGLSVDRTLGRGRPADQAAERAWASIPSWTSPARTPSGSGTRFSVVLMRTVLELQGTPCIPMEEERDRPGPADLHPLLLDADHHRRRTAPGPERLRASRPAPGWPNTASRPRSSQRSPARRTTTRRTPRTRPSACRLPMPTADPVLLTKAAHALLPRIHEGVKYVRAGIMVTDLRPTGNQKPLAIFENPHEERGIGPLLEDIARRYGRGSIGLGHAGIRGGPDWSMKRGMRSPVHHPTGPNSRSSRRRDGSRQPSGRQGECRSDDDGPGLLQEGVRNPAALLSCHAGFLCSRRRGHRTIGAVRPDRAGRRGPQRSVFPSARCRTT